MKTKQFLSLISTIAILFSFSACGNYENSIVSTTSNIPIEQTTSTVIAEKSQPNSVVTTDDNTTFEASDTTQSETTDPIELINSAIAEDLNNTFFVLNSDYEQLKLELDTYKKYINNADTMEAFYDNINTTNQDLIIRLYEYSLDYADAIVNSNMSFDEKYDELDEIYDNIYDDAGDDIYDEIYDGLLQEIYDDYYNGLLKDASDTAEYKEWSNARADEYDLWSDARADIYKDWSNFRSDIYEFWSELRSEMWSKDLERALEKIEDFRNDIAKMKE